MDMSQVNEMHMTTPQDFIAAWVSQDEETYWESETRFAQLLAFIISHHLWPDKQATLALQLDMNEPYASQVEWTADIGGLGSIIGTGNTDLYIPYGLFGPITVTVDMGMYQEGDGTHPGDWRSRPSPEQKSITISAAGSYTLQFVFVYEEAPF